MMPGHFRFSLRPGGRRPPSGNGRAAMVGWAMDDRDEEGRLASIVASGATTTALATIGKLRTAYGINSAQAMEERFQARSAVLLALAKRATEIRKGARP